MQIEEQNEHSQYGRWDEVLGDASLFPDVSQPLSQHERYEWQGKWDEAGNVQDVYKSLPITPTSPQMSDIPPFFSLPVLSASERQTGLADNSTMPLAQAPSSPIHTQSARNTHSKYVDMVEQAIERLNDAARRIAAVEQKKEHRAPRASRLAPFHDISGEIQRHSTPLPQASSISDGSHVQAENRFAEMWSWPDEENEQDLWANHTDPLIRRRFPDSAETARIEEEDVRRARAEGFRVARMRRKRTRTRRLKMLFTLLAVLAVFALVTDAVLVSLTFIHQRHTVPTVSGPPTLTLTTEGKASNQVSIGQNVTMHLRHFTPSSKVYVTHDFEEPILFGNTASSITVDNTGAADVTTSVDAGDWEPGFHMIDAEDTHTHYTASATLQIVGSGPTPPSHLLLGGASLDFGSGIQGSNTLRPFTLSNTGHAAITWTANSDQSWLVLSPNQGIFSRSETIEIGVQRGSLAPGDYNGKITFSTNVGAPTFITIHMSVNALPANAGPVLMVTPAVLSFNAQDGGANPTEQELVISNPGTQPLTWSLTNNGLVSSTDQNAFLNSAGLSTSSWLGISPTSGTVIPKATSIIHVDVNSQNLLPGAYIDTVVLTAGKGTLNSTQSVSISLTVLPQCGLTPSTGAMSFTSVANSNSSTVQALNLRAMSGCGAVNWHASASPGWLLITPTSGQASATTSSVVSVNVNPSNMSAGVYTGAITITSGAGTQTVQVTLQVQPPPPPGSPVMAASPLTMNFTAIEGQSNPNAQAVVISNTGQSPLQWHTQVNLLANGWLGASPTGGIVNPGQVGQVMVAVNASGLTPGNYNGQVIISGTDTSNNPQAASGSPQTVNVQLQVSPPCGLQAPSSSSLAFSAVQGGANPSLQTVTFTASGNCNWPVNWQAGITSHARWLTLSALSGTISSSGQPVSLDVNVNVNGLAPGTYTTQVSITASDATPTAAQGSPDVFTVTLTVLQPCQLQSSTPGLTFSTIAGQISATQSITIQELGNCARPISWSVTSDSGSSGWLILSPPSGSDAGAGATISVSVNANTLAPGTYSGTLTVSASGTGGALVQGSPLTISVGATVTGLTVSGSVNACVAGVCTSSVPLVGATVNLLNGSGTTLMSTTASTAGTYSLSNVSPGTYTISVTGLDSSGVHYVGSSTVKVSGNITNENVNVLPG